MESLKKMVYKIPLRVKFLCEGADDLSLGMTKEGCLTCGDKTVSANDIHKYMVNDDTPIKKVKDKVLNKFPLAKEIKITNYKLLEVDHNYLEGDDVYDEIDYERGDDYLYSVLLLEVNVTFQLSK